MENQLQDMVAIVNLTDKEFDIYQKEYYSYPIKLLKPFDLFEIKPSVGIIICDVNTEINKIWSVIRRLKKIEATIILFSDSEPYMNSDDIFVLGYEEFGVIRAFLEDIDYICQYQKFPKDCVIGRSIQGVFEFITRTEIEGTRISLYKEENVLIEEALDIIKKDFENDERKFKELLLSVESDEKTEFGKVSSLILNIKDIIGVESMIFQICTNDKMGNKVNLRLIISYK